MTTDPGLPDRNDADDHDVMRRASPRPATLTLSEAATVLGISRSTAYELARTGELPALRLGRRLVVPIRALDQLLESVSVPPKATGSH